MTAHEAIIKTLNEVKDHAEYMKFVDAKTDTYKAMNSAFEIMIKWADEMIKTELEFPTIF